MKLRDDDLVSDAIGYVFWATVAVVLSARYWLPPAALAVGFWWGITR